MCLEIFVSVSDQLNITEAVETSLENFISVSDQVTISESITKLVESFISISDQVNITESITIKRIIFERGPAYLKSNQQDFPLPMDDSTIN